MVQTVVTKTKVKDGVDPDADEEILSSREDTCKPPPFGSDASNGSGGVAKAASSATQASGSGGLTLVRRPGALTGQSSP